MHRRTNGLHVFLMRSRREITTFDTTKDAHKFRCGICSDAGVLGYIDGHLRIAEVMTLACEGPIMNFAIRVTSSSRVIGV